jgi:hypothetical protein
MQVLYHLSYSTSAILAAWEAEFQGQPGLIDLKTSSSKDWRCGLSSRVLSL